MDYQYRTAWSEQDGDIALRSIEVAAISIKPGASTAQSASKTGSGSRFAKPDASLDRSLPWQGQDLSAVLRSLHPIAYGVNLARITQDPKVCLLLSQLIYWTQHGTQVLANDGWIFKSREQWILETGLTRHEQQSARGRLKQLGLIEEGRVGLPARSCYRLITKVLGEQLSALLRCTPVQWSVFDVRANSEQVRALIGSKFAFYRGFVELTGSCVNAIYLSKALSIQRRIEEKGSVAGALPWDRQWFRMKTSMVQDDTGLTQAQQRKARAILVERGLLHEALMTHPRRQTYVRIDLENLCALMTGHAGNQKREQRIEQTVAVPGAEIQVRTKSKSICATFVPWRICFQGTKVAQMPKNTPVFGNSSRKLSTDRASECQNRPTGWQDSAHQSEGFCRSRWSVLALLHARAGCLTTNQTTTTTTKPTALRNQPPLLDKLPVVVASPFSFAHNQELLASQVIPNFVGQKLVMPEALTPVEQMQCRQLVAALAPEDRQEMFYELIGQMAEGSVRNPVSYLRKLVQVHLQTPGGMVFEKAQGARQRIAMRSKIVAMQSEPAGADGNPQIEAQRSAMSTAQSAAVIAERQRLRALAMQIRSAPPGGRRNV